MCFSIACENMYGWALCTDRFRCPHIGTKDFQPRIQPSVNINLIVRHFKECRRSTNWTDHSPNEKQVTKHLLDNFSHSELKHLWAAAASYMPKHRKRLINKWRVFARREITNNEHSCVKMIKSDDGVLFNYKFHPMLFVMRSYNVVSLLWLLMPKNDYSFDFVPDDQRFGFKRSYIKQR